MGRFFNREAALVALSLLVAGVAIGLTAGLRPWIVAAVSVGLVAVLHWPLTMAFQGWVLEFYVEHNKLERALGLALEIRDSSVLRRERQKAMIDVALVHLARGDYDNAIKNLRGVVTTTEMAATKAVVNGSWGYSLAHLGRDLEQAEELIQSALRSAPEEPLFGYFLGLLRFKQGRLAEAKELMEKSIAEEPDPKLPYPGERSYVLAQVLEALGDAGAARAELEKAKAIAGRFGEMAARKLSEAA